MKRGSTINENIDGIGEEEGEEEDESIDRPLQSKCHYFRVRYRARYFKSKPAVLVLLWSLLVRVISGHMAYTERKSFPYLSGTTPEMTEVFLNSLINMAFFATVAMSTMLYPIAGFVADVCFGRYRTVIACLWITWLGTVSICLASLLRDFAPASLITLVSVTSFVLLSVGQSGVEANFIQLGLDQLQGASSDELSCFISWSIWTFFTGKAFGLLLYYLPWVKSSYFYSDLEQYIWLSIAFVMSLLICLLQFSSPWFVREHTSSLPYKTVFRVLNFVRKHKFPIRNGAFADKKLPSRINFAKGIYGGPFRCEEVEDVKTLLWMLAILFVLCVSLVTMFANVNIFIHHLSNDPPAAFIGLSEVTFGTVAILIPAYELVIRPLISHYTPKMLHRILMGLIIGVVATLICLFVDLYGQGNKLLQQNDTALSTPQSPCMFITAFNGTYWEPSRSSGPGFTDSVVPSSVLYIPCVLFGAGLTLVFVSLFEFVLAQSPYSMKGMLIGLTFCLTWGLPQFVNAILMLVFVSFYHQPYKFFGCGSAYYATDAVIGLLGVCLFGIVVWRYRYRERVENVRTAHVAARNNQRRISADAKVKEAII